MQAETIEEPRTRSYQLSDLDDDADIDVLTEVQQKTDDLTPLQPPDDTQKEESPLTQIQIPDPQAPDEAGHERNGVWGQFLKKKWNRVKESPKTTEQKKRDWSREQETLAKIKSNAVSTLNSMGTRFNEGSTYLYEASRRTAQATADNLKKIRLFRAPIEVLCRNEAAQKPCPRLILICCTAIASTGLSTEDIFKQDVAEELIHAVDAHFLRDSGAVLPPNGATPEVLAAVIKQFLIDLDEPLFTYRLMDEWMHAGLYPQCAPQVVEQLPPTNRYSLDVLLDCLNRISGNAAANRMDPGALAQAIAPCLLWKYVKPSHTLPPRLSAPAAPGNLSKLFGKNVSSPERGEVDDRRSVDVSSTESQEPSEKSGRVPLSPEETDRLIKAISHLIANYRPS